jgi:ArsR family transcriptional regulator
MQNENGIRAQKGKDYGEMAELLKVLGHPVRLKIICDLMSSQHNVSDILNGLGLPQATVSQHLATLRNQNIIKGERRGHCVHYTVVHPAVLRLIEMIRKPNQQV